MSPKLSLLLLVIFLPCVISSDINFTADPSTIEHLMTDQLHMKCALLDGAASSQAEDEQTSRTLTASDIKFVSSIVIARNNKDIATISSFAPASTFENGSNVQVSGQVTPNGSQLGVLELTWSYPGIDQGGSYTCQITGFDERGHPKIVTQTLEILETEVSLTDLVRYVHSLQTANRTMVNVISKMSGIIGENAVNMSNMQRTIDGNAVTISNMSRIIGENAVKMSNMQRIIDGNAVTISNMSKIIDENTKTILNMSNVITNLQTQCQCQLNTVSIANISSITQRLEAKLATTVGFTAALTNLPHIVTVGHPLVFDKIITSVGGGYDKSRGIFTCPVAGIYLIHVHVKSQRDRLACFLLEHNDVTTLEIYADDRLEYQSASNSASLRLQVGDTIKVTACEHAGYPQAESSSSTSLTVQLVAQV